MDIAAWERLLKDRAFYMQMDVFYFMYVRKTVGRPDHSLHGVPQYLVEGAWHEGNLEYVIDL